MFWVMELEIDYWRQGLNYIQKDNGEVVYVLTSHMKYEKL